mgnify:CR=1 FL=1
MNSYQSSNFSILIKLFWFISKTLNSLICSFETSCNLLKYLEKRRQYKGYKKQWLYYRCREEGLLETYYKLFDTEVEGQDSGTKFSFGKYRGEYVEAIWESDKEYINWLSQQEWLAQYLDESDMIHELLLLEEENQN